MRRGGFCREEYTLKTGHIVLSDLVGYPRAYRDRRRGLESHRLYTRGDRFFLQKIMS